MTQEDKELLLKVVCKNVITGRFIKSNKNYWTKGKTYIATQTVYDKFSVKDNSGIPNDFTKNDLERYFDIINDYE